MKSSLLNPRPVRDRIGFANLRSLRACLYPDVLVFLTDGPQNFIPISGAAATLSVS